jgi:hypothetical protein
VVVARRHNVAENSADVMEDVNDPELAEAV